MQLFGYPLCYDLHFHSICIEEVYWFCGGLVMYMCDIRYSIYI